LVYENIFCPSEFFCYLDIKLAPDVLLATLHDNDILRPANFSHQWCEFFIFLIRNVEISHPPKIRDRKTLYPRNSFCRSFASVSTIALPQPSFSCFATIDLPMSQYRFISSLFTALRASYWALYMRSFISLRNALYSVVTTADI